MSVGKMFHSFWTWSWQWMEITRQSRSFTSPISCSIDTFNCAAYAKGLVHLRSLLQLCFGRFLDDSTPTERKRKSYWIFTGKVPSDFLCFFETALTAVVVLQKGFNSVDLNKIDNLSSPSRWEELSTQELSRRNTRKETLDAVKKSCEKHCRKPKNDKPQWLLCRRQTLIRRTF